MSTTWITLAKLAGPLVGEVERLLLRWAEHKSDDPDAACRTVMRKGAAVVVDSAIVDPAVVAGMVAFMDDLERHADLPPVVYFARYVDPWTTAASLYFIDVYLGFASGLGPGLTVGSDEIGLAFFRPSSLARWKRSSEKDLRAKDLRTRFQNAEEHQFAIQLHQCLASWEELLEAENVKTCIVLAFRGVGGCWLDEEVEASARALPAWFRRELSGEDRGGL